MLSVPDFHLEISIGIESLQSKYRPKKTRVRGKWMFGHGLQQLRVSQIFFSCSLALFFQQDLIINTLVCTDASELIVLL